ncbi:MAG: enoyl-CoA hydratase/isomerase family protein [Thermoanaerobaculia bacterium]|nr:enoyl-CoA hydratase/isomerase family protein [Thermoanaerobaculia bacterium]
MSDCISIRRDGRCATIELARPPLNILDLDLLADLDAGLAELAADSELQLVLLRGGGERAFSAGVSVQDHTPDKLDRMLASFHGTIRRLRSLDALSVALVDGHCLGGGLELATACDLVLASERSRFALPEIKLGCFPPVALAQYPSRIGLGRTLDLVLTGRGFDAAEALRLGLIDECVPAGELAGRAAALAAAVTAHSAAVTRLAVRAGRAGAARPFDAALAEGERIYLRELAATADMAEGLAAFGDKREPVWRHR